MLMFRPSSSTCRFSSRVPNNVSILGVTSILFFIQGYSAASCSQMGLTWLPFRCLSRAFGARRNIPILARKRLDVGKRPAEARAPVGRTTTINLKPSAGGGESQCGSRESEERIHKAGRFARDEDPQYPQLQLVLPGAGARASRITAGTTRA